MIITIITYLVLAAPVSAAGADDGVELVDEDRGGLVVHTYIHT